MHFYGWVLRRILSMRLWMREHNKTVEWTFRFSNSCLRMIGPLRRYMQSEGHNRSLGLDSNCVSTSGQFVCLRWSCRGAGVERGGQLFSPAGHFKKGSQFYPSPVLCYLHQRPPPFRQSDGPRNDLCFKKLFLYCETFYLARHIVTSRCKVEQCSILFGFTVFQHKLLYVFGCFLFGRNLIPYFT